MLDLKEAEGSDEPVEDEVETLDKPDDDSKPK